MLQCVPCSCHHDRKDSSIVAAYNRQEERQHCKEVSSYPDMLQQLRVQVVSLCQQGSRLHTCALFTSTAAGDAQANTLMPPYQPP